jgi:hypothetical protein
MVLHLSKEDEQQLRPILEVQRQVASKEEALQFKEDVLALQQAKGLALGSMEPRAFWRSQQRPDGSGTTAAVHMAFDFVVQDPSGLEDLLDAQTGMLVVPGSGARLTARYNSIPVRCFELDGCAGWQPKQVANKLRQQGYHVLAADWATLGGCHNLNAVRIAAACTGLAPSSITLCTSSTPRNLIMREVSQAGRQICEDMFSQHFEHALHLGPPQTLQRSSSSSIVRLVLLLTLPPLVAAATQLVSSSSCSTRWTVILTSQQQVKAAQMGNLHQQLSACWSSSSKARISCCCWLSFLASTAALSAGITDPYVPQHTPVSLRCHAPPAVGGWQHL